MSEESMVQVVNEALARRMRAQLNFAENVPFDKYAAVTVRLPEPQYLGQTKDELGTPGVEMDPATLPALAARYGCQVDFPATATILQRHGLRF